MLTFLQHGQSRKGAKEDVEQSVEMDGKNHTYSVRSLTSYKHQSGYLDLVRKDGTLETQPLDIPGTLFPGAAVRHNKFGDTKHEGSPAELLAAYFALIGTISLPINRGSAVLMVPEVSDLVSFAARRREITPKSYQDCLIGGIGDAVLGVYARLRGYAQQRDLGVEAVSAYLFRPTVWASQQKSRVAGTRIKPLNDDQLGIFTFACDFFKPALKTQMIKFGKGKAATEVEQTFWSVSMVKPLIADNLANQKPWFHNFSAFYTRNDPATGKPLRSRLFFEKEGLSKMIDADVWSDQGQKALVTGVHYALFCQFGRISGEFGSNKAGMKNKFQKEFEKWRIQFASAKTADQFRFSVCDLMSRARGNTEIQENWQAILPLLSGDHWHHGRDLALLALASYKGKGDKEAADQDPVTPDDSSAND
jgi:CRISPR-associated protein Cas8a1/Csx13